jgi:nucleolar protein 4
MLKRLAGWSCKAFESDVKRGRRSPLTLDELRESVNALAAKAAEPEVKAEESMAIDGDETEKTAPKDKKKFGKGPSKVKQSKILRQDDRLDPLTGLKRSKGYGFLEMHTHADALRVIRWANANSAVHKLFHSWWMEDLKFQIERLQGDTGKKEISDTEKEVRIKRMQDKLKELEGEDEKSIARQGKTLIIEFSIENAVTVKRRDEKVDRVREKNKKRKRETDDVEVEAKQPEQKVEQKADKAKKQEHNPLGSMIGKKRRLAKARKGK